MSELFHIEADFTIDSLVHVQKNIAEPGENPI